MKIPSFILGLAILTAASSIAQDAPGENRKSLASREADACSRNLKTVFEAIQSYRKTNKDLPQWLSDLTPEFLADPSLFVCPVTIRTGRTQTFGLADPKVNSSYTYEFSAQEVPADLWGGSLLSMRQFKNLQMAVVGGDTPILRCYHHDPCLNVGFNGRLYESEQVWENQFASVVPLRELAPRQLLIRFNIPHKANQGNEPGRLNYLGAIEDPNLTSVVGIAVSSDGRFVYAAAYSAAAILVFSRDAETGLLTPVQTFKDPKTLGAAVRISLSPDGRLAVVASFQSNTVTLFKRDPETGRLELSDVARQGVNGVEGLQFAIAADFCPNAPFIYSIAPGSGAVSAFEYSEQGKLQFVEANRGTNQCFDDARGLAFSLDGRFLYVVSSNADTLAALQRDPATGRTRIHQLLEAEKDEIPSLMGAFQVTLSPDGRFLYTSSGRFRGNSGIGIYRVNPDQTVTLVKELLNGKEGLTGLEGGNQLVISQSGLNLWVVGSRSHSILTFARNPESGLLTQLQTLQHDPYGAGPVLMGAANLALSPDEKHVYVGAEGNDSVSIFKRGTGSASDSF